MSVRKSNPNDVTKQGKIFGENIKCTLVGDKRVGKTSMLLSFQTDTYPSQYIPTILDTYSKSVDYNGTPINLQLYDIGGEQELINFEGQGHIGTDVFLLCFAIDDHASFSRATNEWFTKVQKYWLSSVDSDDPANVRDSTGKLYEPITILVGCKSDKNIFCDIWKHRSSRKNDSQQSSGFKSMVTSKEAIEQATNIKACLYAQCSARKGTGIKEIFNKAIHEVLQRRNRASSHRYIHF